MSTLSDTDTWQQLPPSHSGGSVGLVLYEGEASVLGLVGGAGVDDDLHHPVGDLPHLRQDLLAFLGFGDPSHEQAAVVNAGTHTQQAAVPVGTKWDLLRTYRLQFTMKTCRSCACILCVYTCVCHTCQSF